MKFLLCLHKHPLTLLLDADNPEGLFDKIMDWFVAVTLICEKAGTIVSGFQADTTCSLYHILNGAFGPDGAYHSLRFTLVEIFQGPLWEKMAGGSNDRDEMDQFCGLWFHEAVERWHQWQADVEARRKATLERRNLGDL